MEENSDLNLNEVYDLINKVRNKEKKLANEFELVQLRMNGNDVIQLAKTSISTDESLRCANLVNQRVQESQNLIKEKVKELTGKSVKKVNHIQNNINNCGKSRVNLKKDIPKNESRKPVTSNHQKNSPSKQLSKQLQFCIGTTNPVSFPKISQTFLKDDINLKSTRVKSCAGNLMVLGVRKKFPTCKADSAGIKTMKQLRMPIDAAVQTSFEKNSRNFGVQVEVNPNFKLIQIKSRKNCEIQVLPSINIQALPSSNFRLEEVMEREKTQTNSVQVSEAKEYTDDESEINYGLTDDDLLSMTLKSQTFMKSSLTEPTKNLTFSKDVTRNENLDIAGELLTYTGSGKYFAVVSNPEDETYVSQDSLTFENPSVSNVKSISAVESKINHSVPCVVKEVAIQTSELSRTSVSSQTKSLSSSSSWPDISGLSLGELIVKSTRKNNEDTSENSSSTSYFLSEGEIPPQNLRLVDKLMKVKRIVASPNQSLGEVR